MTSYHFDIPADIDSLTAHTYPIPHPQRGEVLVRVRAVSLNYRDIAILNGRLPPAAPGRIPLGDAAGEIVEIGESVYRVAVGDHVISTFHPSWIRGRTPANVLDEDYGSAKDGWLTQYKVVSQEAVVKVPRDFSYEEACTLPCAGETAYNALKGSDPVKPGDIVLTQGTGGVSVFAVQLAKALGATVMATTSSKEKEEFLHRLGADYTINYVENPDWGTEAKKLTGGRGVDRVVEVVGADTISKSLDAVARDGEIALIGVLSESGPGIDYFKLLDSGASVRPAFVGDRVLLEELVRVVVGSGLKPVVCRVFDFEDSIEAFHYLADRKHIGKVVIRIE